MTRALCRLALCAIPPGTAAGVYGLTHLPAEFWTWMLGAGVVATAFAAWSGCWAKAEL